MTVPRVPRVPAVPWVWFLPVFLVLGCNSEPRTWKDLQSHVAGLDAAAQDVAIEKFVAARGGNPIIENQTRLIFLVKDRDGVAPRIVGDFNGWATTPQGYDVSVGKTMRLEGTSWSYLESTSYTNARLEYVFFYDKDAVPDPLNQRTVQAFAGPRSAGLDYWREDS